MEASNLAAIGGLGPQEALSVRPGAEPSGVADAPEKEKVNVRIPLDLAAQVKDRCTARSTELGWKVRPANVYLAALEEFAPAAE